ncbi:hypothetical protein TeGR_g346, partial [Tetraparma gracilis]
MRDRDGVKQRHTYDLYDDDEYYGGEEVEIDGSYSETTRVSMWRVDEQTLNYDLVVNVLANLTKFNPDGAGGAVLVFLPGMGEIKQLHSALSGYAN